jgi:transcription factor 1
MLKTVTADPSFLNQPLAGRRPPLVSRAYMAELEAMEAEGVESDDKAEQERLKMLRYRDRRDVKDAAAYLELLQLRDAIFKMEPSSPEFAAAKRDFDDRLENTNKNMRNEYFLIQDGYHLFRHQAAHTLLWDRRAYEPLTIDLDEFYPNAPICLLDIQPKAMDPVFRQNGPSSNRSGDYSSLMLRALFRNTTSPVYPTATDALWPGFAEVARDHCPSLWDPALGGSPMSGHGSLKVRAMSETQWTELMKAWMRWPFRPEYLQMLGRSMDSEEFEQESDQRGVAQGQTNTE